MGSVLHFMMKITTDIVYVIGIIWLSRLSPGSTAFVQDTAGQLCSVWVIIHFLAVLLLILLIWISNRSQCVYLL